MGLDMYLEAEMYVSAYKFSQPRKKEIYGAIVKAMNAEDIVDESTPSGSVNVKIGYWRKANHIHNWFVENVQEGEDDCKRYYVSQEQIDTLIDLCKAVLSTAKLGPGQIHMGDKMEAGEWKPIYEPGEVVINPDAIAAILPTKSGFFFGGMEYDRYYLNDIRNTITILERAKVAIERGYNIYYQSSW